MTPLSEAVAARLAAAGRRRWPAHDLAGLVADLRPELALSAERFVALAEVVDELTAAGVVRPAKARLRMGGVALPRSIEALEVRPRPVPSENPALRHPWAPPLAWAASGARRPAATHAALVAISDWVAAHPHPTPVPVRERSLEVLGDDKALERLVAGVLRGREAAIAALAVERVHPPMALGAVDGAAGRDVLVVENGTTFHSALRAARAHAAAVPVRYAFVGYGAGEQLAALLPSLAPLAPEAVDYFGDLDPEGLRFAARGAAACGPASLPALRPAGALYDALLARGRPQRKARPAPWPAEGLAWLGEPLAAAVRSLLGDGDWLAQEWVGREALAADVGWCRR